MNCSSPVVASRTGSLDSFTLARVSFHAQRLSRQPAFRGVDREDLEQELILDLLKALPRFDRAIASRNTFVCRVINRRCASLLRDARRRHLNCAPLDSAAEAQIDHDARHRLLCYTPADPVETAERAEAVRRAVEGLPRRLRKIAALLMHHTQAEVARILQTSETAIDRARKQMLPHFEAIGREELF